MSVAEMKLSAGDGSGDVVALEARGLRARERVFNQKSATTNILVAHDSQNAVRSTSTN